MSKILLIGDPHLKITKFDLAKSFLAWINKVIALEKPDLVVNLGDTFDTHAVLRSEVMTEFMNHVDLTLKTCPYVYLIGNHDQYKPNDNKYHALTHLKNKINNFIIIDSTCDIDNITYVPYVHDPTCFPKTTQEICIAHQSFTGADYGNIACKDGVDASLLERTAVIISGHIHKRQEFNAKNVRVIYPGTPFSQTASDIDQIKGISIFDTSTYDIKFIQSPFPMWRTLKYELTSDLSVQNVYDNMELSLNSTDNWVIDIIGPKIEVMSLLEDQKIKNLLKNKNIKIKVKFNDKDKKKVKITALSMSDIVDQYIDKVYTGTLSKETLKIKAKQIMAIQ